MKKNNNYLKKLQSVELEILREIDKICKNNDIKYFISGGTLLGAVRHKGFIPWDDDIDIAMTRKNYNKFIEVCKKELNDRYFLDNYKTNKRCSCPFTKVKMKNTLYVENRDCKNYSDKNGIWVDIFPLDGVKKKLSFFHKLQGRIDYFLFMSITIKNGDNYYKKSKIRKKIYQMLLKCIPIKLLTSIKEKNISFYDEDKVNYLCSFTGIYPNAIETYEKEKLFPYENILFECEKFSGISGSDYYLNMLYGDYMKLPPIEKRRNHLPFLIKFYDGEIIEFDNKRKK